MTSAFDFFDHFHRDLIFLFFFSVSFHENDEEIVEEETVDADVDDEVDDDPNQIKPFRCELCSISFTKFDNYREHFVSVEHRYKRRDEKKRLGVCKSN